MDESERQACRMYLAMLAAALIGVAAFLWIGAFRLPVPSETRAGLAALSLVLLAWNRLVTEFRGML